MTLLVGGILLRKKELITSGKYGSQVVERKMRKHSRKFPK